LTGRVPDEGFALFVIEQLGGQAAGGIEVEAMGLAQFVGDADERRYDVLFIVGLPRKSHTRWCLSFPLSQALKVSTN
jgi:hypothetical protein